MKIQYDKEFTKMHPRLKEILELVHAKRPLLEYVVTNGLMVSGEATRVDVYQDGQQIGRIDAKFNRANSKTGENVIWYALTSHTIVKERGNKNTKYCKDAKTASRVVIEMFVKRGMRNLGEILTDKVNANVQYTAERIAYSYGSALNVGNTIVADYFVDLHLGKNPALPQKIMDQIVQRDMVRMKENADIAKNVHEHLRVKNGYAIQMMQDETLLCAPIYNLDLTAKYPSTYELPPSLQEKFTMLKVLDENQFAADIGVKFKLNGDMCYFIVAGETKVM